MKNLPNLYLCTRSANVLIYEEQVLNWIYKYFRVLKVISLLVQQEV